MAEWARCPPVHRLVAGFIGYEAKAQPAVQTSAQDDGGDVWRPPGAGIPASPELAGAGTPAEALAAAERMFYGVVKDGI